MSVSRRDFIATAALGSIALGVDAQETRVTDGHARQSQQTANVGGGSGKGKPPILISSANGWNGMDAGYGLLGRGHDTLDAAIAVGKVQEDDANDNSVGLGGLPNEDGDPQLDSSCMHGPTRRAGSVAAVRNIKNVSLLAQYVMQHTGHVMLVGDDAERFGLKVGFRKENLLTEKSRQAWMLWKESMSSQDWWGPGLDDPNYKVPEEMGPGGSASISVDEWRRRRVEELAAKLDINPEWREFAIDAVLHPPHGTIHCSALNAKGDMSGMTTTSGLAWKIAGRAGDSPIIGAGCYTDQDVGSAGATGSGEENIRVCGAHSIVENMRKGMEPAEAGLDVLRRIARNFNNNEKKLRYVGMTYYILRKDGAYAGVCLWSGPEDKPVRFCVHDGNKRLENCIPLFKGASLDYPPRNGAVYTNQPKP